MTIQGPTEYSTELIEAVISEFINLRDRGIKDIELNRAKNIVKMNIL